MNNAWVSAHSLALAAVGAFVIIGYTRFIRVRPDGEWTALAVAYPRYVALIVFCRATFPDPSKMWAALGAFVVGHAGEFVSHAAPHDDAHPELPPPPPSVAPAPLPTPTPRDPTA